MGRQELIDRLPDGDSAYSKDEVGEYDLTGDHVYNVECLHVDLLSGSGYENS